MPKRRGARGGLNPTSGAGYAPVSLGTGVRANSRTPAMKLEGTDRIAVVNWGDEGLATGAVLFNLLITTGIFKSLRDVAKARQYIRWDHLSFKISCGTNTSKDGSYVAAFVADAEDVLPEDTELALEETAGAPGMIQDSVWRTRTVDVRRGDDGGTSAAIVDPTKFGHFTSTQGEPRFFSPGILRALVDGRIGQSGTMVLYCSYKVTLFVQARQGEEETEGNTNLRNATSAFAVDDQDLLTTTVGTPRNIGWLDFFPGTEPPDEIIVFRTTGILICGNGDNDGISLTTNYLKYIVPNNVFAISSGPSDSDDVISYSFSSPNTTTDTQLFGAGNIWEAVEEAEPETARYAIRTLPHGGVTNERPKKKKLFKKIR